VCKRSISVDISLQALAFRMLDNQTDATGGKSANYRQPLSEEYSVSGTSGTCVPPDSEACRHEFTRNSEYNIFITNLEPESS
jgi:hypothetical protein